MFPAAVHDYEAPARPDTRASGFIGPSSSHCAPIAVLSDATASRFGDAHCYLPNYDHNSVPKRPRACTSGSTLVATSTHLGTDYQTLGRPTTRTYAFVGGNIMEESSAEDASDSMAVFGHRRYLSDSFTAISDLLSPEFLFRPRPTSIDANYRANRTADLATMPPELAIWYHEDDESSLQRPSESVVSVTANRAVSSLTRRSSSLSRRRAAIIGTRPRSAYATN
ncbi:hypothetical protein PM082_023431 [Marasmius tenuissimus]|nr:hypothetical protein PM082_023431 [Marasmius tenuissimus]